MQEGNTKSALTLGICILLGLSFLGYFLGSSLIKFKEYERTVTVKGLSEKEYPADVALWPIHFSSANNDLAKLYASIEKDTNEIIGFLKSRSIISCCFSQLLADFIAMIFPPSSTHFFKLATVEGCMAL